MILLVYISTDRVTKNGVRFTWQEIAAVPCVVSVYTRSFRSFSRTKCPKRASLHSPLQAL